MFQFGEMVPREICNHEASESIGIQLPPSGTGLEDEAFEAQSSGEWLKL